MRIGAWHITFLESADLLYFDNLKRDISFLKVDNIYVKSIHIDYCNIFLNVYTDEDNAEYNLKKINELGKLINMYSDVDFSKREAFMKFHYS